MLQGTYVRERFEGIVGRNVSGRVPDAYVRELPGAAVILTRAVELRITRTHKEPPLCEWKSYGLTWGPPRSRLIATLGFMGGEDYLKLALPGGNVLVRVVPGKGDIEYQFWCAERMSWYPRQLADLPAVLHAALPPRQ